MFCIVKYADPSYADTWCGNPQQGVVGVQSIWDTLTGKDLGIKQYYKMKEEADADLIRAIEANPCVGYAVCPIFKLSEYKFEDIEEGLRVVSSLTDNVGQVKQKVVMADYLEGDEKRNNLHIAWENGSKSYLPHYLYDQIYVIGYLT